jgi:hypothetical protein
LVQVPVFHLFQNRNEAEAAKDYSSRWKQRGMVALIMNVKTICLWDTLTEAAAANLLGMTLQNEEQNFLNELFKG